MLYPFAKLQPKLLELRNNIGILFCGCDRRIVGIFIINDVKMVFPLGIYNFPKGKGIVVLLNKWDLMTKETNTARDYEIQLKRKLAPFTDVPILFVSVTEKLRIFQAMEMALKVYENRQQKITTSKLNEVMQKAMENYHAPVVRGNAVKIKFVTQLHTVVPSFAFFCNYPDDIKTPHKNYLENKMRENFELTGVPIRIFFRKK